MRLSIITSMFIVLTNASSITGGACSIQTHVGVRINGYDIGNDPNTTSSNDCCAACSTNPKCKAFLFVPGSPTNVCWLKSAAVKPENCKGCIAGGVIQPTPPGPTPTPPGCNTDIDCNMAGRCQNGLCTCDVGWTGNHCELVKFGKSFRCGSGGLCLNHTHATAAPSSDGDPHFNTTFTASWGGEAVRGDNDTDWHIYAASFDNDKGLGVWLDNSRVVHGVGTSPFGPYLLTDIALGPIQDSSVWDSLTQHNPAVQKDPATGTYLLYYMGSTNNSTKTKGGGRCASHPESQSLCNQRVGLATSTSPYGPWTRRDAPIIDTGPEGEWDDQFTTNPTPHVFPNGSVLLIYKARSMADFNDMRTGVAYAEHWAGPYKRILSASPIDISGSCEDAGIYQSKDMGVFR